MHDDQLDTESNNYGNGDWDTLVDEVQKVSKGSLEPYRRVKLPKEPEDA